MQIYYQDWVLCNYEKQLINLYTAVSFAFGAGPEARQIVEKERLVEAKNKNGTHENELGPTWVVYYP